MITLKKGDLLIILLLLVAGIVWFIQDSLRSDTEGSLAVIEVEGKRVQTLSMDENGRYKINLPNDKSMEVMVENNEIWVLEETVDCPQKICVRTGKISKPGETIVCLPNKTVIYIEGFANTNVDDISF